MVKGCHKNFCGDLSNDGQSLCHASSELLKDFDINASNIGISGVLSQESHHVAYFT